MIAPTTSLPMRPSMPSPEDDERVLRQTAKWQVLSEDYDSPLLEFMETKVDAQRLAAWGSPDSSSNVLADLSRQFTTPGLYGSRPEVKHADVTSAGLVGARGEMDAAGYWTLMQSVQYFTVGLGDFFVRLDADAVGLSYRIVLPHNIWVRCDHNRPTRAIELRELRLRHLRLPGEAAGRWIWAWDCYDLGETYSDRTVREPSYRVVGVDQTLGVDLSEVFLGTAGGLLGAAYPYRWARKGEPFIPFAHYRSVNAGNAWNDTHKRGALRGTLNAATFWTYAGHCARDASGRSVIAAGLMPIMGDAKGVGDPNAVRSLSISPGSILYHSVQEGAQPFVHEVGPGGNLDEVSKFAHSYEMRQLARWGIGRDDIAKAGSDPASGAALFISRQGKREYAAQVRPLFEASDLEAIAMSAALLRLSDGPVYPEDGYSIEYGEIAQSPQEQQAEREDLDWDLRHGHISEVEAYMRRHPGTDRDDAVTALTRAEVERAQLQAAKAVALAEAGLLTDTTVVVAPGDAPPQAGTSP